MFWGNLQEKLFSQILILLNRQGLTGVLYLRRGRALKAIKIESGEPVAVKTTLAREGIVRYLWEKKRVAPNVLSEIGFSQSPFDEAISKGIIPESARVSVLREIYVSRILDVFGWRGGEYIFWPAFLGGEMEVKSKVPLNADELVNRGILGRAYPGYLYQVLKDKVEFPIKVDRAVLTERNINLPEQYRWLFGFFDSAGSVAEMLRDERISNKDLIKLVAMLYSVGVLKIMEQGSPKGEKREMDAEQSLPSEPELAEYARTVDKFYNSTKNIDYFSLLEVNSHIPFIELQNRYNELMGKIKPSKFYGAAQESVRKKADEISEKLTSAYDALRSLFEQFDRGRHSSLKSMLEMLTIDRPSRIRADVYFIEGLQFMDSNSYAQAHDRFVESCKLRPQEGEYWAYRGYTSCRIAKKSPDTEGDIQDAFKRAKEFDPDNHIVYYLEAESYSSVGELNKAREILKVAQKLKPSSRRVAAKLRVIESQISGKPTEKVSKPAASAASAKISEREQVDLKLEDMIKRCQSENLYEVLGIKDDANPNEIRQAYFKLVKEYHPDILGTQFPEIKLDNRLREIIEKLEAAFEILSDPKKLETYNQYMKVKRQRDVQVELDSKRKREREFQRATAMIQEGHYNTAEALLEQLYQEDGDVKYQAYAVLAKFLWDNKHQRANVEETLNKMSQITQDTTTKADEGKVTPKDLAVVYLVWGKLLKKVEDYQTAYEKFVKASKLDPTLTEAIMEKRGLRAQYGPRGQREAPKKEGFKEQVFKFFKGKKLF